MTLEDTYGLLGGDAGALPEYAQIAIFNGGCPSKDTLKVGDISGARYVDTVRVSEGTAFKSIGDLPKENFGFAALLRKDDCTVLAFGCTPVSLEHHRHVTIALNQRFPPAGACDASQGLQCVNGQCSSESAEQDGATSTDGDTDANGDGSTTKSCTLEVVGGENIDPPSVDDLNYAGPNLVPTATGFVLVYREVKADGTGAKGIRLPFTDQGAKGTHANFTVPSCPTQPEINGLASTWNQSGAQGFSLLAMPVCTATSQPSVYATIFDGQAGMVTEKLYDTGLTEAFGLAPVSGVAPYPSGANFYVATTQSSVPKLLTFTGVDVQTGELAIFNGGGASTFAQVATGSEIIATTADTDVDGGAVVLHVQKPTSGASDAGADDASADASSETDAGEAGTGEKATYLPQASIAALTAWKDRALAVVPKGSTLVWQVVDSTGAKVQSGTLPGGPYKAVDAVALRDHVFVVAAKAGKITVFRFDDASGTISATAAYQGDIPASAGNATLGGFTGQHLAISAARKRVAIAWLSPTAVSAPAGDAGAAEAGAEEAGTSEEAGSAEASTGEAGPSTGPTAGGYVVLSCDD